MNAKKIISVKGYLMLTKLLVGKTQVLKINFTQEQTVCKEGGLHL